MSLLDKLTFANTTKKAETSQPNLVLRRKMVAALDDQIAGAHAEIAGQPFVKEKQRWMPVEGGSKELCTVQSALRKFWFRDAQGHVLVELRFGNKPLNINGKPSILVGEMAKLPEVLMTLREAVLQGELDADLCIVSDQRRRLRKGKNGKPTGLTNGTTNGVGNGTTTNGTSTMQPAKALFLKNGK